MKAIGFVVLMLIGFVPLQSFSGLPFDGSRCGIEFPKLPADLRAPPTTSFVGTTRSGIKTEYWPLLCRAGVGVEVLTNYDFGALVGNTNSDVSVEIKFQKAAGAGGPKGASLRTGECAWVDRPLDAGEINKIWELYDFEKPGLQIKSTRSATGVQHTAMPIRQSYQHLVALGGVVVFYVSGSRHGLQMVPFCSSQGGQVTAKPFYQL